MTILRSNSNLNNRSFRSNDSNTATITMTNNSNLPKTGGTFYEQEQFNAEYNYEQPKSNFCDYLMKCWSNYNFGKSLLSMVPIHGWLSSYNCKKDFIGDLISGCTVAVMHIPQGIGYALLANVPPVIGIYMAFFPVLIYFFLGTSRHNSMGTFAVISIMVGKSVLMHSGDANQLNHNLILNGTGELLSTMVANSDGDLPPLPLRSPIMVATTVCFLVGIIQLVMYVLRLGIISSLLSETLVSGFTTGAAVHVLTSQLKDLFGLTLAPINGNFKLIYIYIELAKEMTTNLNVAATAISAATILILIINNNEQLKKAIARLCPMPVPIELIIVVAGTLFSKYFEWHDLWQLKTIGHIPLGFPEPTMPDISLLKDIVVDSFIIAMVSYTVSISMALIFAQKLNYEIDFNQELLAMGAGNVFGSFFSCMPFSASLSRSTIQQTVGGKTQIASLVSCALLAVVLLWIGSFFEPLPRCILASIICFALKGMLLQVGQFFDFCHLSRLDGCVWLITFLTVVIVSIDIGLLVGILLSLACIFCRGMKPYTCLLGNIPNTDLYLDKSRYASVEEIPKIKIYHYCGSLNFASRNMFKTDLYATLELDVNLAKQIQLQTNVEDNSELITTKLGGPSNNMKQANKSNLSFDWKCLIFDFTALSYVDNSGMTMLKQLIKDFSKLSILVYVAGSSCPVYEMMKKCNLIDPNNSHFKLFPTIHDAVHHAMNVVEPISIIINETTTTFL